jgi:hypothetical protein
MKSAMQAHLHQNSEMMAVIPYIPSIFRRREAFPQLIRLDDESLMVHPVGHEVF